MDRKPTYGELEVAVAELGHKIADQQNDIRLLSDDHTRLQAILETAIHAIIVVNDRGKIIEWNSQAELLCGWQKDEIIGQPIFKIMPARYRKMHKDLFSRVVSGERGRNFGMRIESSILYRDEFEVEVELAVALNRIGTRNEITVFLQDITERKRYESQLHLLSVTDELTGLFNRRGFMTLGDKQLKAACRDEDEIFLLFADFDNMKWVNDTLGHSIGDDALIETALLLKNIFRQADLIGRVGGDEFIVLISNRKGEKSEKMVVERLEQGIRKANNKKDRKYKILLSYGTVRYDHDAPCTIEELVSRADQLMYSNKRDKKEAGLDSHT
ncbi:MAG: diguanylate cyclase [Proteobacteria bacterium]|nr:diguanylate cyclase [Pseudomonadota bacterium]MBU1738074.1 diguanylate cyclase [Pseudomonadota bacterium]